VRYLYKILLISYVVFLFENPTIAAPVYSDIETGKTIPINKLKDALKNNGVIVTLSEGDSLNQNGFNITASQ